MISTLSIYLTLQIKDIVSVLVYAVVIVVFALIYGRTTAKYGIARLWMSGKKKVNMVPINPETGRVLRIGEKVKINESVDEVILREIQNDKKCVCRNAESGEIFEGTLHDCYFMERPDKSSSVIPADKKKALYVCIHYPDSFGVRIYIPGPSNYIFDEIFYCLEKYVAEYNIHLGRTQNSMGNFYFYNDMQKAIGATPGKELIRYDDNLSCVNIKDGTAQTAQLLIAVDSKAKSTKHYLSKADELGIKTAVIKKT